MHWQVVMSSKQSQRPVDQGMGAWWEVPMLWLSGDDEGGLR